MTGDLSGRTCLVTGANRGIGREVAAGLARQGASVVLGCRDERSAEEARNALRAETGSDTIDALRIDLASQKSVREAAARLRERHPELHLLVNNAGIVAKARAETEDGIELTFAVNHLSAFLLTNLLLRHLEGSAPARIVNVTSAAHKRISAFDDPQSERGFDPIEAYCKSKLANVLFTYQLAQRLGGTGITVNCVHPGTIRTGLVDEVLRSKWFLRPLAPFVPRFLPGPEKGAEAVLHVAASPDLADVSGKYFENGRLAKSSSLSYDEIVANQLWESSLELTARSR